VNQALLHPNRVFFALCATQLSHYAKKYGDIVWLEGILDAEKKNSGCLKVTDTHMPAKNPAGLSSRGARLG